MPLGGVSVTGGARAGEEAVGRCWSGKSFGLEGRIRSSGGFGMAQGAQPAAAAWKGMGGNGIWWGRKGSSEAGAWRGDRHASRHRRRKG